MLYITLLFIVKLVNLVLFFVFIVVLPDVFCLVNKDFQNNKISFVSLYTVFQ